MSSDEIYEPELFEFSSKYPIRKTPRLQGYDYSLEGGYFVTVCTRARRRLFGEIQNEEMNLNEAGKMIVLWWNKIPEKFKRVDLDAFVVMPDHVHGVLFLNEEKILNSSDAQEDKISRVTLFQVLQWFKTMTTNAYIRGVKENGWLPYSEKLWERSFYDHIIRNDADLNRIREYVSGNPCK